MRVGVNRVPESIQLARAMRHVPATEQQRVHRRVSRFSIGCDQKIVPENRGKTMTKSLAMGFNAKCLSRCLFWKENRHGYLQCDSKYKPRLRVFYEAGAGSYFIMVIIAISGAVVTMRRIRATGRRHERDSVDSQIPDCHEVRSIPADHSIGSSVDI